MMAGLQKQLVREEFSCLMPVGMAPVGIARALLAARAPAGMQCVVLCGAPRLYQREALPAVQLAPGRVHVVAERLPGKGDKVRQSLEPGIVLQPGPLYLLV